METPAGGEVISIGVGASFMTVRNVLWTKLVFMPRLKLIEDHN